MAEEHNPLTHTQQLARDLDIQFKVVALTQRLLREQMAELFDLVERAKRLA